MILDEQTIKLILFGAIASGLFLIYTIGIYPWAPFVEVIRGKSRWKLPLSAALLFLMPVGSYVYAILFSKEQKRKWMAVLWAGLTTALIYGWIAGVRYTARETEGFVDRVEATYLAKNDSLTLIEKEFLNRLMSIKADFKRAGWEQVIAKVSGYQFSVFLAHLYSDGDLSENDLEHWVMSYDQRGVLPFRILSTMIAEQKELQEQRLKDLRIEELKKLLPPLAEAISKHEFEKTKELLSQGGDPNILVLGVPALTVAVSKGWVDIAKLLLQAGARVDERVDGLTPLMLAVSKQDVEMVKLLSDSGADPTAQDERSVSKTNVLALARNYGNGEIVKILNRSAELKQAQNTQPTSNH